MEHEQKPRERSFIRELVPDWRPTREQQLWATRSVIILVAVLGVLTLIGLPFRITLWNWMDLLIIPAVLAVGGYLYTRSENRATRVAAERRAQDEALQAYLDQMGQLLLDKDRPLRQSGEGDEVRTLAQARTSTVLGRLSSGYKSAIITFLAEAGLVQRVDDRGPIIALSNFNLYGTDLSLSETDLRGANLSRANLSRANLSNAILLSADLSEADLSGAVRRDASLGNALLMGANLSNANLSQAHLIRSTWKGANLSNATGVTNEELAQQAKTLEGATMPNGQKYEEWLKSKGSGDDGENSVPS